MKLSIAWIFDHIDADWHTIDVQKLIDLFNQKTAEIEHVEKIEVDLDALSCAQVRSKNIDGIVVYTPEWDLQTTLPERIDAQIDDWFLIKKNNIYNWATQEDVGGSSTQLLPAVYVDASRPTNSWKTEIEPIDYILEVDNTSITHRPDLWGHRGFAREVAALLDVPLKPIDSFVSPLTVIENNHQRPFELFIKDQTACSRFATLFVGDIKSQASHIAMAQRLSLVDVRPIDALVDVTNYVMFDVGHPMHAFDAEQLDAEDKTIVVRRAVADETLKLLDGRTLTLDPNDLVIAHGDRAISLAGVMGGDMTGVTGATRSLLLEAACFDAPTIRLTAQRHKIRTDASARFEKQLDPHQPPIALARAHALLKKLGLVKTDSATVSVVGQLPIPTILEVEHSFIEKRLGIAIDAAFVERTLTTIGFQVEQKNGAYVITVPSYRATKDIQRAIDIVEEIGRFYGYNAIVPALPAITLKPSNTHKVERTKTIKEFLAFGLQMREIYTYAFYDGSFLSRINWEPHNAVSVQNPVSVYWRQLVTSLVPNAVQIVERNAPDAQSLRFFELARVWHDETNPQEASRLAGIFYEAKKKLNFYDIKADVTRLFSLLGFPVTWKQISNPDVPWLTPHISAEILHEQKVIGVLGAVPDTFLHQVVSQGSAYVFECDADFLLAYNVSLKQFEPLPKYQLVDRDISVMVPLSVTVQQITEKIEHVDTRITCVVLIDHFEKESWADSKSLTFRYTIQDETHTLAGNEIEVIEQQVAKSVKQVGAEVRS